MLLSFLSDIKNFTMGSVHGGLRGMGRWGGWAFGYHGDSTARSGQFSHFKLGGLLAPALVLGILAAPFSVAAPALALGAYAAGVVGLSLLGGTYGFLAGGFNELREGQLARREWKDQLAQQHDHAKLSALQEQIAALDAQKAALQQKMMPVHERMESRRERGGHVDKLLQQRTTAASGQHKGK